ncbi:hypothetical protein IAR50_000946 [Cryptococcus sp. DSM 104548]
MDRVSPLLYSVQQTGTTPAGYHESGGRVVTTLTEKNRWVCDCPKGGKNLKLGRTCSHIAEAIKSLAEFDLFSMNDAGEFSVTSKVEITEIDGPGRKDLSGPTPNDFEAHLQAYCKGKKATQTVVEPRLLMKRLHGAGLSVEKIMEMFRKTEEEVNEVLSDETLGE